MDKPWIEGMKSIFGLDRNLDIYLDFDLVYWFQYFFLHLIRMVLDYRIEIKFYFDAF